MRRPREIPRSNATPRPSHASDLPQVRFKHPVHVQSFRIVCAGEVPHAELPFRGQTPPVKLGIEMFGCDHGKDLLCTALLAGSHRREDTSSPSATHDVPETAAALRCSYLVIRTDALPLSLCLYGTEALEPLASAPPKWHALPGFWHMRQAMEAIADPSVVPELQEEEARKSYPAPRALALLESRPLAQPAAACTPSPARMVELVTRVQELGAGEKERVRALDDLHEARRPPPAAPTSPRPENLTPHRSDRAALARRSAARSRGQSPSIFRRIP